MKHLLILAVHLLATIAKLVRPGGVRAVVAESLLLKHQLLIRAFPEKADSEGDSHAGTNVIQASCWEEASMDGEAVFGGLACTRSRRG
jgi:hypothetical protein